VDKYEEKIYTVVNTFGKKGLGMLFDQFKFLNEPFLWEAPNGTNQGWVCPFFLGCKLN
jgi:hypothetical protein